MDHFVSECVFTEETKIKWNIGAAAKTREQLFERLVK